MTEFPIQPIYHDEHSVIRFRENAVVRYLLDKGAIDLNHLSLRPFPQADREQFYQLIGYSLCGFHELSEVSDVMTQRASARARETLELPSDQSAGCRDEGCEIHCGVDVCE